MKKRLFGVTIFILIFVYLINTIPLAVSAAVLGDDYPEKYKNPAQDTVVDDYSFWNRECTSFVAWRLNHTNGVSFTNYYLNGVRVHNDIDKVSGDNGNGNGTKMGHAKYWGTAFQSMGYTVDSTPAVGAILWLSSGTYGHVAWVAEVSGTNVTVEEYNNWYGAKEYTGVGQYGVYDRITKTNAEFLNSGYRYIHVNNINDSQATTLSLEKQNYLTNEHVTFYYSTSLAHSHYNVKIFKNNQLSEIISTSNGYDVRYFSEPGTYSAYFEVVNNNTVVDTSNTIYFTVQQEYTKPSNVRLSLEKNTFNVGEHTTFYPDGNYVLYYIVTVYKNGNVHESVKIDPYHYYTNSYTEVGNYIAYAEAYNASGIVYSNNVEFSVCSISTLEMEKQNYLTNEHVTFYYNAPASHTHCNVKIFKNNQLTEIISTSNGFDVRYFSEPGTYSAYFEVVNNNNVIDTSNTIYFTVQQEYTKPSNVQLALEKNTFNVGEHTTFYPDGNYVLYYIVTVYKDGNVYESVKIDPYSYYTNSYKEIGNYIAYAEAYNASGIVYSNNVEFIVQAPMPSIHGTLQLEENNIKITVSPINVSNGIIIIAGYNNDKLISFQLEDSIQENSTHTLSSNIDKVKLMVWSDLKSMSPVCSPVTIGVKE